MIVSRTSTYTAVVFASVLQGPTCRVMASCEGGTASRSTFEHPTCTSAVEYVQKCCRDKQGNPWPPKPKGLWKGSYEVHKLSKADVPTLDMMKVNRGQAYREGHYPPFPSRKWKASAVICARWDRSTDEGALREWLDHHRCVSGTPLPPFLRGAAYRYACCVLLQVSGPS